MIQRTQEITIRSEDEDFENRFRACFYGLISSLFCASALLLTMAFAWRNENGFGAFVAMLLIATGGGFAYAMCYLTYNHLHRQHHISAAD